MAQAGQRLGGTGDLSHRTGTLGLGESLKGFVEEMPSHQSLNHRKAPGMWDKSREVASDEVRPQPPCVNMWGRRKKQNGQDALSLEHSDLQQ